MNYFLQLSLIVQLRMLQTLSQDAKIDKKLRGQVNEIFLVKYRKAKSERTVPLRAFVFSIQS